MKHPAHFRRYKARASGQSRNAPLANYGPTHATRRDPLPRRERQLLDALKRSGLEVAQTIGKRGNRWSRYVRKQVA